MSDDLDRLAFTLRDELSGLVIVQTEVPVSGMEVINVRIPDERKFSLRGDFILTFGNGLSLSSTFSSGRIISELMK